MSLKKDTRLIWVNANNVGLNQVILHFLSWVHTHWQNILKGCSIINGYSKTCVKRPFSKRQKIGFQDQSSLNAGQKYCRMLKGEHSAILSTFIKLPFVFKIFVLSIFECLFYLK